MSAYCQCRIPNADGSLAPSGQNWPSAGQSAGNSNGINPTGDAGAIPTAGSGITQNGNPGATQTANNGVNPSGVTQPDATQTANDGIAPTGMTQPDGTQTANNDITPTGGAPPDATQSGNVPTGSTVPQWGQCGGTYNGGASGSCAAGSQCVCKDSSEHFLGLRNDRTNGLDSILSMSSPRR